MSTFNTQHDVKVALPILVIATVHCLSCLWMFNHSDKLGLSIAMLLALPGALVPVWCLLGTRYVFIGNTLRIFCGPFFWSIPLCQVRKLKKTRSHKLGPAFGCAKLEIFYSGSRRILVSPHDELKFIEAMRARNALYAQYPSRVFK